MAATVGAAGSGLTSPADGGGGAVGATVPTPGRPPLPVPSPFECQSAPATVDDGPGDEWRAGGCPPPTHTPSVAWAGGGGKRADQSGEEAAVGDPEPLTRLRLPDDYPVLLASHVAVRCRLRGQRRRPRGGDDSGCHGKVARAVAGVPLLCSSHTRVAHTQLTARPRRSVRPLSRQVDVTIQEFPQRK